MKTVKLPRSQQLPDECRRYALRDDPQDCYGLTIGSIDKYQNQAELNVGSTQQTFVHSLTGFQNGTLNIDAGGNVTVNQGSFAGTIEGAGQLTIAQNGSYVLSGAQSMALTGDIVVDDGAVLSLEGDAADLTALGTIRSRSC